MHRIDAVGDFVASNVYPGIGKTSVSSLTKTSQPAVECGLSLRYVEGLETLAVGALVWGRSKMTFLGVVGFFVELLLVWRPDDKAIVRDYSRLL